MRLSDALFGAAIGCFMLSGIHAMTDVPWRHVVGDLMLGLSLVPLGVLVRERRASNGH